MPCVAHLMLVMLRLTPFVAHLMLVIVLNLPEQCSFQDLLFHLLFLPKSAEKSASRMDISLLMAYQLWRVNQYEHACSGLSSPSFFPSRSGILLHAVVQI